MSENPDAKPPGNGHHWVSASELDSLREKLREAQETLEAIQSGDVDAVVVSGERGSQIYTLTGAEEPYRIYVEQMQEGAVTASEGGLILYCNRRFAEMTGIPLERVISTLVEDFLATEDWKKIREGMAAGQVVKFEAEMNSGPGKLPVLITANRLETLDDPVFCLVVTDLSAQKQQQQLAREKEEAEAANQSKDVFLAVLSHELRTPLTPALMGTYLLEKDSSLSAKSRDLVQMIRRNVEVETRLIDDLLDLTRITQGKIQLQQQTVDMHALLQEAINVCQPDLLDKAQTVELDLRAHCHRLTGDPVRLQQILWNLIRNASKFSERKAAIFISSWNDGSGALKIEVRDTGIGIEPEILPKLFNPFEQGDEEVTRKFGGLGLGLVISSSLARLHLGGAIEAFSEGRDRGSRFVLTLLPLDEAHDAPGDGSPGNATGRVLLVEDNDDSRMVVRLWLESMDYEVVEARTVGEALAWVEKMTFSIFISDIGLPDGTGYDFMHRLPEGVGTPAIAMSGFGQQDDVAKSKAAGFRTHLVKPVAAEALENALRTALA